MAAAININPSIHHTVRHDLESFIWVLVHMAILYAPSGLEPRERGNLMSSFDCFSSSPGSLKSFVYEDISFAQHLQLQSKPLTSLLSILLSAVEDSNQSTVKWDTSRLSSIDSMTNHFSGVAHFPESMIKEFRRDINKSYADRRTRLSNHNWIINTFKSYLDDEEWKAVKDHCVQIYKVCVGRGVLYLSDWQSARTFLDKFYT